MPAEQCNNGKWKWGKTGACKYDSKLEAENDNKDYYRALEDIDLTPTKGMVEAAKRGLELREEFGRGGTEVGVKTANMIIDNQLTIERIIKMYAYFKRHEVDKEAEGFNSGEEGYPSAGKIAWMLWGDDAGMAFSERKRNEINEEKLKEEKMDKRHIKKVIEDDKTVTIVFGKSEEWEGVDIDVNDDSEEIQEEITEESCEVCDGRSCDPCENESRNIWNKKYNNESMEKRVYTIETRVKKDEDDKEMVEGYASIFNSRSENLGNFYEYISPDAISQETIDKSDVRALINHDESLILARSTAGTLKLSVDQKGLKYSFDIPETTYGRDLAINMKNGNITQSSFAFTVAEDDWTTDAAGNDIRTITKIDRLYDVSPVSFPAYSQAEADLVVAKRGLACYKETLKKEDEEKDLVARSLAQLKIELIKRNK